MNLSKLYRGFPIFKAKGLTIAPRSNIFILPPSFVNRAKTQKEAAIKSKKPEESESSDEADKSEKKSKRPSQTKAQYQNKLSGGFEKFFKESLKILFQSPKTIKTQKKFTSKSCIFF